jgi:hypothetical protein
LSGIHPGEDTDLKITKTISNPYRDKFQYVSARIHAAALTGIVGLHCPGLLKPQGRFILMTGSPRFGRLETPSQTSFLKLLFNKSEKSRQDS